MPEISAGHHYLSPSSSLDFAAPRIHAPGGFSFYRFAMITLNSKTCAVVVTAPRPLTKEQREAVRADCANHLPVDVAVIVLDPGFTVTPIGDASATLLDEVRALRADLTERHAEMSALSMRVLKE
jgi:hypothetical protein